MEVSRILLKLNTKWVVGVGSLQKLGTCFQMAVSSGCLNIETTLKNGSDRD